MHPGRSQNKSLAPRAKAYFCLNGLYYDFVRGKTVEEDLPSICQSHQINYQDEKRFELLILKRITLPSSQVKVFSPAKKRLSGFSVRFL